MDALAGFACDGDIGVVVTVSRIVGEPALHVPSGSGTAVEEGRADDVARSVRAFTGSGLSYQANKGRPQALLRHSVCASAHSFNAMEWSRAGFDLLFSSRPLRSVRRGAEDCPSPLLVRNDWL